MSNIAIFNPGAVVANQVIEYKRSVNTPDYENDPTVVINPDLSLLDSIPMKYWVVNDGVVVEMTPEQKTSVDSYNLPTVKNNKKRYLQNRSNTLLNSQGYTYDIRSNLLSMYSDGIRMRPNGQQYIQPWVNWLRTVDENIKQKNDAVDAATTEAEVQAIELDEPTLIAGDPQITTIGSVAVADSSSLSTFLDGNAEVTDSTTGIKGPFYLMQELFHRKDLYNDSENPLYDASHTPILGTSGILESHVSRISSIETIHQKLGWHEQEVTKANYTHPKDLLIYYGWLNSFNSATNGWNNEKVAQDMAKYYLFSFGDGVQNPSHGDFANTQTIIPRLKNLNPEALIFGYVSVFQDMSAFQTKVDQWDALQVHGIFLDEAGYDFGTDRSGFNARVDYVHGKTYSNLAFANAWNPDHILGTNNDVSYPNTTYNPSLIASKLTSNDWILLESYPINTSSYLSTGGYESRVDWALRGLKMESLRVTYGVNFAAGGVIDNASASGNDLYKFGATSALMWSLEGFGTSDTNYGAGSAAVKFWDRQNWAGLGKTWSLNPSIQIDLDNTNIFHRYAGDAHLKLDFTEGAYSSTVDMKGYTGAQGGVTGIQGIQGVTGIQGIPGDTGIRGVTGLIGATGIQGIQGNTGLGIQGNTGLIGATGFQGRTGVQGFTGIALGATGVQGRTGVQGVTGFQGRTGVQGQTGLGIQGVTGLQGTTGIFSNSRSFVLNNPTAADNPLWRSPAAATITNAHFLCVDGTNIIGSLWEYNSNGAAGTTVHADATALAGVNLDTTTFTNAGIAAANYVGWKTLSVSGSVTRAVITFEYTNP